MKLIQKISSHSDAQKCKQKSVLIIDIKSLQNRLLKVCYAPTTSASLPRLFCSGH